MPTDDGQTGQNVHWGFDVGEACTSIQLDLYRILVKLAFRDDD